MLDEFRSNPHMEVKVMQDRMMRKFGVHILNHIWWRARRLLKTIVEGRHDEGYKPLPQYVIEFKKRNPTSSCVINWTDQGPSKNPTFKRCVICLGAAVESFKAHCRPLIGIDACHLKGPYKGVLMTAMGIDGNNGQFPLPYGVTSIENKEEWSFFLYNLAIALGCQEDASGYTIMSDRHLGIIAAVDEVMPKASRRICTLHLYKNFAANYLGAWFHCFFYVAANAYSPFVFEKATSKIKAKDPAAYQWLKDCEPLEHWARFKFDHNLKCDDNTTNFVESFNFAIVKHRGKPVYTMLEEIRKLIGSRFDKCSQIASSWDTKVTPYVVKKLKEIEQDSRACNGLVSAGRGEFDVVEGVTNFTVSLPRQYCDCQKWQITGLPCKHAARCIKQMKHQLEDYCSDWYSAEKYKKLYDNIIYPIPDSRLWGESELPELDPPFEYKRLGRPPKHKRRESIFHPDNTTTMPAGNIRITGKKRCKVCKALGRNSRSCGKPPKNKKRKAASEPKPRGRPKKSKSSGTSGPAIQCSQAS